MAKIFRFPTLYSIATNFFICGRFLNFFLKLAIGKKMLAAELSCGRGGEGEGEGDPLCAEIWEQIGGIGPHGLIISSSFLPPCSHVLSIHLYTLYITTCTPVFKHLIPDLKHTDVQIT
jgi:hypothetical protein